MPTDRELKVAETMYYYGFNRDDSARLATQIVRNLDRHGHVQEILFKMGIIE